MVTVGYFLSCEEFGPGELVEQAKMAEQSGFERLWISDHYHPWSDQQGQSPFVWSVIGALSQTTQLPITTAVTCPTVRIHPAVIAQASATAAVQLQGRFILGVGSGEALNEHILGDHWPNTDTLLEMLAEAVEVIRKLHSGARVNHRGTHYTVDNARIYTLPDQPVPIYLSGFGPKAATLAGEIADGFISVKPDADAVKRFRQAGGGNRIAQAGFKVCFAPTHDEGIALAHQMWPNDALPGELSQILPTPRHFEQATQLVTPEMIAKSLPAGPDPQTYVNAIQNYVSAGFDEVYVQQIGNRQREFFEFWRDHVQPALNTSNSHRQPVSL